MLAKQAGSGQRPTKPGQVPAPLKVFFDQHSAHEGVCDSFVVLSMVMKPPLSSASKNSTVNFCLIRFACLIGFVLLFAVGVAAQEPTRRIVILSNYQPNYPGAVILNQSITSTIRNGSSGRVEFFYEYQDNLRIPNTKYENEMVRVLQKKYEGENIDLVLALGAAALEFLLKHESQVFTGIPKLYYFHDETEQKAHMWWPRVTGVFASPESNKTLDLALSLLPETQTVAVVTGNSYQDKFVRGEAQKQFRPYEGRLHFTYLSDLTIEELKEKTAALPPNTVIIYLSFTVDKLGHSFTGPEALSRFAPTANAPVFGIAETYLGAGMVGGCLVDFNALGKRLGEVALRTLAGEKAPDITPQTAANMTVVDWRQILRWKLDQRGLPAGSIVRFKEPTFWDRYKWYVVAAAVAFVVQAALILFLLFTRARRRQAENERERLAAVAETEHQRMDEVVSNVPGIVWESRTNPANGVREPTFVSDYAERMLGYSPQEWMATPEFALSIVHEDDRERVRHESDTVIAGKKGGAIQFRWIAKDGRVVWAETHLAPILDRAGEIVGLRGVTLDITEKKFAEVARLESEERNRAILRAIPDLIFVQTRDGVYLDYHVKNSDDLFLPPEVFLGRNMRDILPEQLADTFSACFERAEMGDPQVVEYALGINGSERWFEARIVLSGGNILSVVREVTSRRKIEDALRQNEAELAGIIESAMDAIITIDQDQRIVLFNAAAEKLFGCAAAEALGQSLDQFIPERLRHGHRQHVLSFGQTNTTQRSMGLPGELYGLKTSGDEFPIEASISQIELNGKQFYTVILRDITERKQAIDELRESEERFAKAFKANPQPMSLTTIPGGLYIDVNDSFLAMSGYTREEVVGHTSSELNVWEKTEDRKNFFDQLNEHGSLVNYEMKFRRKDGSLRTLLLSTEKLEIDGKDCLLIAASDITDRMRTQQELRESEARFRNMADTAPVMIWVADEKKDCTYVNKRWLAFTGRTLEEELGHGWTNGIHPDDYARCSETFVSSFDKRAVLETEYRLRNKDGQYRWVLDSATPRFSTDGVFLGYIGSCLDITERKESEVALKTAHQELHELKNQLEAENIYLQEELQLDQRFGEIVGQSEAIKYVLFKISQVAPTDATVLIMGETGTGKELVARAIHGASSRKDRPLIKVDCGALAPSLIESELFGHEKGAFTGADARKLGRFELANSGTIFLDEIGELPLELQVKLLRLIQESEFERLGGTQTIKVDVRIIAATNRNLKLAVDKGKFREDLWYRLNVYPITIPPLRQRKEDIPLLVEHFANRYAKKFGKTITSVSPRAMQSLQAHSWQGNIRELANVVERSVIHTKGSTLQVVDRFEEAVEEPSTAVKTLEEVEREYITRTLENTGWRIEGPYGAAQALGLNPSTLRSRILKLGIQRRLATYS